MRRAHVLVDVPALMYHVDGTCPVIAGHDVRPVLRCALGPLQLAACAVCIPGPAVRLGRWVRDRVGHGPGRAPARRV